jgi:hypothetical protein
MSIEKSGWAWDETFVAHSSGTLAGYQYYFVYSTGAATNGLPYVALCVNATNGTNRPLGVLQNDPAAGQAAVVRIMGITKIATEAAVTAGAIVTCSTGGTALTSTTTGNSAMGKALSTSATTSGEIINLLLAPICPVLV